MAYTNSSVGWRDDLKVKSAFGNFRNETNSLRGEEKRQQQSLFSEERTQLSKLHLRRESDVSIEQFKEDEFEKRRSSRPEKEHSNFLFLPDKYETLDAVEGYLRDQSEIVEGELDELGQSSNEYQLKSYKRKEIYNQKYKTKEDSINIIVESLKAEKQTTLKKQKSDDNCQGRKVTQNIKVKTKRNMDSSLINNPSVSQINNNGTDNTFTDKPIDSSHLEQLLLKQKFKQRVHFDSKSQSQDHQDSERPGNLLNIHPLLSNENRKEKKGLSALLQSQRKSQLIQKVQKKFLTFQQSFTITGKSKLLSDKIRLLISDASDSARLNKKVSLNCILASFLNFLIKIIKLQNLPLFDPENPIKIAINSIIVMYNCFFLYFISIEFFFEAHVGQIEIILGSLAQAAWITEMLIQMNTCLYHKNRYITDRQQIIRIYFKEYLLFEMLPLIFEGRQSANTTINILFHLPLLLKIKGMYIILKKLEFYILQILSSHSLLSLIKLLFTVFILAHIYACLYHVIAQIEEAIFGIEETWITASSLAEDDHWNTRYLAALFWAFSVIMNANITQPITQIEAGFTCLCMLASCVIYGYALNVVAAILSDIEKQQKDFKKDLNILNQFMKRRRVPLKLRRKANISLQDHYANNKYKIESEAEVASKIEPTLLKEVLISANYELIKGIKILNQSFSKEILEKISTSLEEVSFAPRQIIIDKDSFKEQSDTIFIVQKGKVQLFVEMLQKKKISNNELEEFSLAGNGTFHHIPFPDENFREGNEQKSYWRSINQQIVIKEIKSGESFGEYGLFTGNQIGCVYAESKGFTTALKLKRSTLVQILQSEPLEFEKYCEIGDRLLYQKIDCEKRLGGSCMLCEMNDHFLPDCNLVFAANKNQKHFLFRDKYSISMMRNPDHMRKKLSKSNNCLTNLNQIREGQQKINENEEYQELLSHYCLDTLIDQIDEYENDECDSQFSEVAYQHSDFNKANSQITQEQQKGTILSPFEENKDDSIAPKMNDDIQIFKFHKEDLQDDSQQIQSSTQLETIGIGRFKQMEDYKFSDSLRSYERTGTGNKPRQLRKRLETKKFSQIPIDLQNVQIKDIEDHFFRISETFQMLNLPQENQPPQQVKEIISNSYCHLKTIIDKVKILINCSKINKQNKEIMSPKNSPLAFGRNAPIPSFSILQKESEEVIGRKHKESAFRQGEKIKDSQNSNLSNIGKVNSKIRQSNINVENNHNLHPHTLNCNQMNLSQNKNRLLSEQFDYQEDWIWTFDKIKNFTNYFPNSNVLKIIRKVNYIHAKNQKKKTAKKKDHFPRFSIKASNNLNALSTNFSQNLPPQIKNIDFSSRMSFSQIKKQ